MSYNAIYACATDPDFRNRVAACAVQEGAAPAGGEAYATQHALTIASRKDIEAAWSHSLAASPYHSRRGRDESIVTDQMILAAVQALKEG